MSESNYAALELQLARLQRQFREKRIRDALLNLAKAKKKSRFILSIEEELGQELATHKRPQKLDHLLEVIEDELIDYRYSK